MASRLDGSDHEDPELSGDFAEDSSADELPSFNIGLSPTGDTGSSFRTQNDPNEPFQRSNYVERKGAIDIRCSCLDVVHGLFSAGTETFATLIIIHFRFDSRKRARRFRSVNISLEFGGLMPGESGPEVFSIAPMGTFSLVPTQQHEEISRSGNVQLGAAAPVGGVMATGTIGLEKVVSRETNDKTVVMGSIDLKGRNWGKSNCASWTLLENATTKTGIPTSMRTALLLKRKDEKQFRCVVKIDADVDFKSTMERVFGGKPKDDPVLFNPDFEPTHNLQKYDVEELGAFDLESTCDVTHSTLLEGAIKQKTQRGI